MARFLSCVPRLLIGGTLLVAPLPVLSCTLLLLGCDDESATQSKASTSARTSSPPAKEKRPPRRLFLGDEHDDAPVDLSQAFNPASGVDFDPRGPVLPRGASGGACPPEMVSIAGSFCIDRFEVDLVDVAQGRALSPHYPPVQSAVSSLFERWTSKAPRSRTSLGRSLAVPPPPQFSLMESFEPSARSEAGVLPAGYLSRGTADMACRNAGKRLCERQEWVRACRGQENRKFPYGDTYQDGVCNVHRLHHPAGLLHGNSSENHLDPRLGLTEDEQGPLLRRTGASPECASQWGDDAVYDMVGNVDEWISDPSGAFVGGFFSRATREGCDASIDSHSPGYLDYSLGTRCCKDIAQ